MLCLTRKPGERIVIECRGVLIKVVVVDIDRNKTRLGVDAPRDVRIDRAEVYEVMHQKPERNGDAGLR